MGGEDKEKNITKISGKQGNVQHIFDTSMSRLLQDFNSAELLHNTSEMSKASNSCQDSDCETVVTSMKHLHLRRPAVTKQRKSKVSALKKKTSSNTLNLAIAAGGYQRPIVWPARLSNHNERINSNVLRPSRLTVSKKSTSDKEIKPTSSTSSSEKLSKKQNCVIFGNVSSADYSSLSFSGLCKQCNENNNENVQDNTICQTVKQQNTTTGPVKTLCKRQSISDAPPAKFARTFAEVTELNTKQTVFLDYRMPGSSYSCDTGCDSASEPSLIVNNNKKCSSNAILCTEQAAATSTPSSLETVATLGSALPNCDLSVAQSSSDSLNYHEPSLEETNVNELASYFDDLLHIPRKMSVMAEMMYA